ncbi:MAG: hypothetical protein J0H67_19885 [Rhodospirillales bacterium]|nr:hypothetical protein [Rhodospirillales bacterium]MBN8905362.1 hypothetical protein [Rhodospirillales bacterium]
MSCFAPVGYLLHRIRVDGTEGLLMAPDLPTAIADAAAGDGWVAQRITRGREVVLEGEALRHAIEAAQRDG